MRHYLKSKSVTTSINQSQIRVYMKSQHNLSPVTFAEELKAFLMMKTIITSIKINLKCEYLDILPDLKSLSFLTINYRRNPLQILMYKFVYTTMTSHEYDNFLKRLFFSLDCCLTAKLSKGDENINSPGKYVCLRKKTNSNKPKNEFIRPRKNGRHTFSLSLLIHMLIFNPILITLQLYDYI